MKLVLGLLALLLGACAITDNKSMPYKAWRLGFGAPAYMEVWIETADVVDIQGHIFKRAMAGIASIQTPANNRGNPRGWPKRPGWGKGKYVMNADLPRLIYVRWQSLVEPQTYEAYIEIPESVRAIMRKGEKAYCNADDKWITDYRKAIGIGLAPGGIAKAWAIGPCLPPIEITRVEGKVVREGPDLGLNEGRYALKLQPESKAYIEQFGIPYGSW